MHRCASWVSAGAPKRLGLRCTLRGVRRTAFVLVTALALCLPIAAPASWASVKSLKRELKSVKKSRAHWRAKSEQQRERIDDLVLANGQLLLATKGNIAAAVWSIAHTENAADLQNLVLKPAQAGWPCGGTSFFGQTFFSFDFSLRYTDGSCY